MVFQLYEPILMQVSQLKKKDLFLRSFFFWLQLFPQAGIENKRAERQKRRNECSKNTEERPAMAEPYNDQHQHKKNKQYAVYHAEDLHKAGKTGSILKRHSDK